MIEAGIKASFGFEPTVQPDETNQELRKQRNDMKEEVVRLRKRVAELEDRLHDTERTAIVDHVARNPGTDFDDIKEYLRDTVPERANEHLTSLEGELVEVLNDGYYPTPEAAQEMQQR